MMVRGNVLFLILLAVALFAALSYAVTQSNRSGGNNISDENALLYANELTQFATTVESSVTRIRLINSCKDTQISFGYDSDGDGIWWDSDDVYHNPNSPTDLSCHVFHPNGGGTTYVDWSERTELYDASIGANYSYKKMRINGENRVGGVGLSGGAETSELVLLITIIRKEICDHINKRTGVNSTNTPPQDGGSVGVGLFNGTYDSNSIDGGMNGFMSGCFEGGHNGAYYPAGTYTFYHVLIPR